MILIADEKRDFKREISLLSKSDPFGCRIASLYNTYDRSMPFVDYWVQIIGTEAVSLLARLETVIILRLTEKSDIEELWAFIRAFGTDTVICDGKYGIDCGMQRTEGFVLTCSKPSAVIGDYEVVIPEAKEVYSIISQCSSDSFKIPPYESFMLDVGNKLKKGFIRMCAVRSDKPAACVMTLAESADSAVLGVVAVLPEYRREGFGSFLVSYITERLINEGKKVYLHRAADENIEFYNRLGFRQCTTWCEYSRERFEKK